MTEFRQGGPCRICGRKKRYLCGDCVACSVRRALVNNKGLRFKAFSIVAAAYGGELRCNVRMCPIGGGVDVLHLDHVHNDGADHKRELSRHRTSNHNVYRWVLKHPEKAQRRLQLLCPVHNSVGVKNQLRPEDYRVCSTKKSPKRSIAI